MAAKLLNFRAPEDILEIVKQFALAEYPKKTPGGTTEGDQSKAIVHLLKLGWEAYNEGNVLQEPPPVLQVLQDSPSELQSRLEALIDERFAQLKTELQSGKTNVKQPQPDTDIEALKSEIQSLSALLGTTPTQTQMEDLKQRINDYRLAIMREIQKRSEGIALIAGQIAVLEARLDSMPVPAPSGVGEQDFKSAKDKVLKDWRVARGPEKKERIEQALDKFIDVVSGDLEIAIAPSGRVTVEQNNPPAETPPAGELPETKKKGRPKKHKITSSELPPPRKKSKFFEWEEYCEPGTGAWEDSAIDFLDGLGG